MNGWHKTVEGWIGRGAGSEAEWIPIMADALMLLAVLLVALAIYFVALRLVVRLLGGADVERFRRIRLMRDYLERKTAELAEWNAEHPPEDIREPVNARALTNLGTFRAYVAEYLKSHSKISKDHTLLVRQLQATEHGLPMEIYVFTNDNRWIEYEGIQSDIFDHLLAVLPEFGLRVFQAPSGVDFTRWTSGGGQGGGCQDP